jgi:hypothetical protein
MAVSTSDHVSARAADTWGKSDASAARRKMATNQPQRHAPVAEFRQSIDAIARPNGD